MSESSKVMNPIERLVVCPQEQEMLTQIAYCAEGMFDCETNNNLGDAKDWKHQLKLATDKYYDYLSTKTGEQH